MSSSTAAVQPGKEAWSAEGTGERAAVGVAVVHGFTGHPGSMRPVAERLHADGYTVSMPRLPGHGTTVKDMARYRYADWLAEGERVVDDLTSRCEKVVMVGMSVGGLITLDIASRRPLHGVVTINALASVPSDPIVKVLPLLQHLVPILPAKLGGLVLDDIKKPGVTEDGYDAVPLKGTVSLLRGVRRVNERLGEITAPILICASTVDHTVDPENSAELRRRVGSDDIQWLTLEDSYHVAPLDNDAPLLLDTISEFVARVTGR